MTQRRPTQDPLFIHSKLRICHLGHFYIVIIHSNPGSYHTVISEIKIGITDVHRSCAH